MDVTARGGRPGADEYAEYYGRYVARVPDGPIVETLARQLEETMKLLAGVSEERSLHRYAEGKWSLREVLGHLVDTERVFADRALHFARRQPLPLPGIEQDDFVREGRFDARPFADLLRELETVRNATLTLFAGFDDDAWAARGIASECEFTVRAVAWIIAGHEVHHREVVRERYL